MDQEKLQAVQKFKSLPDNEKDKVIDKVLRIVRLINNQDIPNIWEGLDSRTMIDLYFEHCLEVMKKKINSKEDR